MSGKYINDTDAAKYPHLNLNKCCGYYCESSVENPTLIWCKRFKKVKVVTDKACHSKINEKSEKRPKKEKTMFKKIKHLIRMLGMGWLLYGLIFKLCVPFVKFANPYVVWLFSKTPICPTRKALVNYDFIDSGMAWFGLLVACAVFIFSCVLLGHLTKWFFGEK